MVAVGSNNQGDSDEVVAQHLPVVLAAFFNVDHKDLLEPEAQLGEDVELVETGEFAVRPVSP